MNDNKKYASGKRKRMIWTILFFLIAGLSVWAVTSQAKDFSPKRFLGYIKDSDPLWLTAAFAAMICYILFDALMIRSILKGMNYQRGFGKCLSYAASDIYFSAITPSGTGGQPVEAYLMVTDGIPSAISTVVVILYLFFYTVSIVIIGLISLLIIPGTFAAFSPFCRVFIIVGVVIQTALAIFYAMVLWHKKLLSGICRGVLKLISKLRIIKRPERISEKLEKYLDQYGAATELIKGRRSLMIKTLLYNLAHRASQISVTVFCFLAGGGAPGAAPKLFGMQSNVVLGSGFIPTPGAMGAADYMMLDGFSSLMSEEQAANLELLARSTSFYICVLLCGLIVLIRFAMIRLSKKKEIKNREE